MISFYEVNAYGNCTISSHNSQNYRPVVVYHGLGDSACSFFSMKPFMNMIERHLPGIYIRSVMIGDTGLKDREDGFFVQANKQIEIAAEQIAADPKLAGGFNCIGLSQGGQFLRAYVERYNSPPVHNLITLGGQHQGVFAFPDTCVNDTQLCETLRQLLTFGAYLPWVQESVTPANYWHNSLHPEEYQTKNIFLPDINNDGSFNATYKKNMLSLNAFVMVKFLNDTVVVPRASEWFGFYDDGSDTKTHSLQESELYQKDTIGLKQLDNQNKLVFLSTLGEHLQFTEKWFVENILPYLNNTLLN